MVDGSYVVIALLVVCLVVFFYQMRLSVDSDVAFQL